MLVTFVIQSINQIIAPKFAELYHNNEIEKLFIIAKKTTKMMFWAIIPMLLGFVLFGKWFLTTFYGTSFISSYYLLLIISFGAFVNAISGSVGYFLNMCGFEKQMRNSIFFVLFFNIVLNLIFLPWIGVYGAAVTVTITQLIRNIVLTLIIKRNFNRTFMYIPLITK